METTTSTDRTAAQPELTQRGRRFFIPRSRRLTCDVLHFHKQVPLCPHHRTMEIGSIDRIRQATSTRISWSVLFLKAYSLMAHEMPVFRQTWMRFPWSNIYQHDTSVGMLAIQREYQGEPWLFWGRFNSPERKPLAELQKRLNKYQELPVERVFQRFLRLSLFPNPLRRWIWWYHMQMSGAKRARRLGTFFISSLAGRGAVIDCPPSFQTGVVSYGPIDSQGHSRVTLAYDHRLMDGMQVANALARIEQILHGPLSDELRSLHDT